MKGIVRRCHIKNKVPVLFSLKLLVVKITLCSLCPVWVKKLDLCERVPSAPHQTNSALHCITWPYSHAVNLSQHASANHI